MFDTCLEARRSAENQLADVSEHLERELAINRNLSTINMQLNATIRRLEEQLAAAAPNNDAMIAILRNECSTLNATCERLEAELARLLDAYEAIEARQREEIARLERERDESLARQHREHDERLARQHREHDESLARQHREHDESLARQHRELTSRFERERHDYRQSTRTDVINEYMPQFMHEAQVILVEVSRRLVESWAQRMRNDMLGVGREIRAIEPSPPMPSNMPPPPRDEPPRWKGEHTHETKLIHE